MRLRLTLFATSLVLFGCTGLVPELDAGPTDADGDGVPSDRDCDDGDASILPGGDEICDEDGRDEDCDGLVNDEDDSPGNRHHWSPDQDGDGHGTEEGVSAFACAPPEGYAQSDDDCDDADASVYLDAPEICDGIDNDCDGGADGDDPDGPTGAPLTYVDRDGDGYGDQESELQICETAGRIETGRDCDDADATVNPGQEERCDAEDVDEDCNGTSDEEDPGLDASALPTWYRDNDGDGFGGDDDTLVSCETPSGYVEQGGDCDDSSVDANPGESEVCDDGLDNDCDGTSNFCRTTGSGLASSYDAGRIRGWGSSEGIGGNKIGGVGDLDGDGAEELAVTRSTADTVEIFQHLPSGDESVTSSEVAVSALNGSGGISPPSPPPPPGASAASTAPTSWTMGTSTAMGPTTPCLGRRARGTAATCTWRTGRSVDRSASTW